MTIPAAPAWTLEDAHVGWAQLSAEAKHERILCAAGKVFSDQGLDAPMPAVAAAAGAGIASVYRQFPSKRDLLAALVARRLHHMADAADEAAEREGERWRALTEMLWTVVERQSGDDFLGEAWTQVVDHDEVVMATARMSASLDRLLELARTEGRLRSDATALDLRLLFAATRAAKHVEPEAWQRILVLLIDGLDGRSS